MESALVALLNEKLFRSWKVTEENQNAVVIIRLTAVHTPGTAIESQRNIAAITQCSYRRRPPSQLKRDKKRADEFQQKKLSSLKEIRGSNANTDTTFDTDLFLPTPPVSQPDISVQACDTPVSTFTARDTRPQSEVGQTNDKGTLTDNVNTFATCFDFENTETDKPVNLTLETQEKSPEKKAAEEMGYGLLPDHTTQRNLKDKQRNKTFCKVVKGKGDEGNFIYESDDFVFIFDCEYSSRDFSGSEWFPEPDKRRLSKYEGDFFRQLRDSDCVDTNHYKDLITLAKTELKIVGDLVRQYLG